MCCHTRARSAQPCRPVALPPLECDAPLPRNDIEKGRAAPTVADLCARFEAEYLPRKRASTTPWINSFAHGCTAYEAAADDGDVVKVFVRLVVIGDLDKEEVEKLSNEAAKRAKIGKRTIDQMLRYAASEQKAKQHKERRERQKPSATIRGRRSKCPPPTIRGNRRFT